MMVCSPQKSTAQQCRGLTLVETMVALGVLGIGLATTIPALTRTNVFAASARNRTGAETLAQNEIDKFLSYSPFNPQKTNISDGSIQVPKDPNATPPTYDLTIGTHTYTNVPIYRDSQNNIIVSGTLTTVITDVSPTYNGGASPVTIPLYRAQVTVTYTYLSRNYTLTSSTLRVSDI